MENKPGAPPSRRCDELEEDGVEPDEPVVVAIGGAVS